MAGTESNALNAATTGIVGNTGTSFTGTAVTQYNVITGASTSSTLNNVAPSATSGVPLISQGSSAQPIFGTAVVAGGGTGATTLTGILTGNGTSAVTAITTANTAVLLTNGSGVPAWSSSVGSWTPALAVGGSATGITYSTQNGYYFQIGPVVYILGYLLLSSKGSNSGNLTITGLPVATGANGNYNTIAVNVWQDITFTTNYSHLGITCAGASSTLTIFEMGTANVSSAILTAAQIGNTTSFIFSGFYFTN